ncbi:MAG: hypothetical protein GX348_12285 [Veillonellaceae bacterium]|jgi:hypothetical protein|nr:hypothetical protein [Veillonellaceae bacterium]
MGKGIFIGFVKNDGFRYSPESIPEEIKQKIADVFIINDNQAKLSQLITSDKSGDNSESSQT